MVSRDVSWGRVEIGSTGNIINMGGTKTTNLDNKTLEK